MMVISWRERRDGVAGMGGGGSVMLTQTPLAWCHGGGAFRQASWETCVHPALLSVTKETSCGASVAFLLALVDCVSRMNCLVFLCSRNLWTVFKKYDDNGRLQISNIRSAFNDLDLFPSHSQSKYQVCKVLVHVD